MVEVTAELLEVTKMVLEKPQRWGRGRNYSHGRVCLFGAIGVASRIGLPEREAAESISPNDVKDPRKVMIHCVPDHERYGYSLDGVQAWQDEENTPLKAVHTFLDCCIAELRK